MKQSLLEATLPEGEAIVKEAVVAALGRLALPALSRVGKVLVKNPMASLTAAGAAYDVGSSARKLGDMTSGSKNMMRQHRAFTRPGSM